VGLGYASVKVMDADALVSNLKTQLEAFNKATYTAKEFDGILNHLAKGNVFQKAKTLRDRFSFTAENEEIEYVHFFDSENWNNNLFQVTNQVSQEGSFKNRYDVTLLVNGLLLVKMN
jgi:type I restriction enzyme R subunit